MNFEEFKNLVKDTRTVRRFKKSVTIEPKELEEVIDLARITSSATNMQPLKYIIVTNKYLVEKLSETSTWAKHLENWTQSKDERPNAYIVILNDTTIQGYPMIDTGIALNTIMLSLKIKGYAACPLGSIDKEFCKKSFSFEKHLDPYLGIAIGVQNEEIKLVEAKEDVNYYREGETHCVPKRALKDILVGMYE